MRRFESTEGSPATPATADQDVEEGRRQRAELIDRISNKVQAAFWVIIASVTAYYSDVLAVALDPSKANIAFVGLGLAASCVVFAIFCYLVIYLPFIANIRLDWTVYSPRAIPIATAAGVCAFVAFLIGLWPAFGLLTPLILFVLFMGLVMVTHFLPVPSPKPATD